MGDIASIFAVSSGINAVGSAANTYSQSAAIKMQGNYQKNQYQFNSQVADLQAQDAIDRGNKDISNKRKQTKQVIGSQRAALAAQGVEVNADTAEQIQEDTASLGAEDISTIKNNAWREAWGYQVQALDYTSKANFADLSSKFNSKQTLLTGGLNFARDVSSGTYKYVKEYKKSYANRTS